LENDYITTNFRKTILDRVFFIAAVGQVQYHRRTVLPAVDEYWPGILERSLLI